MDETAVHSLTTNGRTSIDLRIDKEKLLEGLTEAYDTLPNYTAYATDWLDEDKFGALGSWENWKYSSGDLNIDNYYKFFEPRSPENGRLIISGSASCLRYWGTMTGAYEAGIKSANWAINFMSSEDDPTTMPESICDSR
jgi:hypothetical protein